MKKQKISLWQFIFKMGDSYLAFLRNLTPTILFLSLALFSLARMESLSSTFDELFLLLVSIGSFFIAISAMVINVSMFTRNALKTLQELHNIETDEPLTLDDNIKLFWKQSNTKLILFFSVIILIVILMVIFYGTHYAFNFYRSSITTM